MAGSTTVTVPFIELQALFEALDLWDKITNGFLSTREATEKEAPAKSYPGATSQILKHFNSAGAQACTTHRIIDPSGKVHHWDELDMKAGDITIAKPTEHSQP